MEISPFLATTLLGGVGKDTDQKIVIGSRTLRNSYLEGFFHTASSCFASIAHDYYFIYDNFFASEQVV